MLDKIYNETRNVTSEIIEKAGLGKGSVLVVGCSTSEVIGERIGSSSSPEVAEKIFEAIYSVAKNAGVFVAFQCCEHLNRAIVVEREAARFQETVNVVPQPKAGGSLASRAYMGLNDPVVVENIKADAGIDIGLTLIGMHLKAVAVPLRLENDHIGSALVVGARTRAKFIGGSRAVYDEKLL